MKLKKYQMGGELPPEETGAPMGAEAGAPQGEQDPVMQLVQMAAEALQAQDPNMAMQVCQGLVELAQGGGEAPAPGGEEPVMMRKGGKITVCKRGKKMKGKC